MDRTGQWIVYDMGRHGGEMLPEFAAGSLGEQ